MTTPKKIIIKDLELADEEIARLRKENKELKKELKKYKHYYDRDKEELMESCYALKKENDEMKNELAECHWLMDEIDYRKREAKRLWWKPNLMEEDTIKELKDIWEF